MAVVRRVLHAEEKVLPVGNLAHLRLVYHVEIVVSAQHLLDVAEARDDGGAVIVIGLDQLFADDQIRDKSAQHSECRPLSRGRLEGGA